MRFGNVKLDRMKDPVETLKEFASYLDDFHRKSMNYIRYVSENIEDIYIYEEDKVKIANLIADSKEYVANNLENIAEIVEYTKVHQTAIMRDIKIDDILE